MPLGVDAVQVTAIPVFYINLAQREDRRRLAEHLWREQLKMIRVTRVPGVVDSPRYRGCTRAHLAAVDLVLACLGREERFVLLAEDDVVLLPGRDPADLLVLLADALAVFADLNVLFLTASLHRYKASRLPGVIRLKRNGALAMAAQIVRTSYLPQLRRVYERALADDVPHDKLTRKVQGRDGWYALDPPWVRQAAGYSDIEMRYVDYGDGSR